MKLRELVGKLALGAFVGCFVVSIVEVCISLSYGPEKLIFTGADIINAVFGSIVIGFGFSLTSFIYDRDDIALPLQVLFQMGIGMSILFIVAIYLKWMPVDLGLGPILTWIAIACVFATIFWIGFYLYHYWTVKELNKKIKSFK